MAYESGTAADHKDLLDKLRIFLSTNTALVTAGQNYTVERWATGAEYELCVKGPGLAGTDAIYTNIITVTNTPSDYFNWRAYGATSFSAAQATDNQLGQCPDNVCMLLWDTTIPYRFFANGRRFIVCAKISSVWECFYAGFGLPVTDTPAEYPYPYYIGGPHKTSTKRWSDNLPNHRSFFDPGSQGGWMRDPLGTWWQVANMLESGANETPTDTGYARILPWATPRYQHQSSAFYTVRGGMDMFDRDSDGGYVLFDALLTRRPNSGGGDKGGRYMWLDGVKAVPGVSLAAEDTITVGADTWHVFNNAFRTEVHDYVAIKED